MSSVRVSKVSNKSFCKVCKDTGKTEREYTSHCVKSKTGQTTCPVLLSSICKYCCKKGHLMSYCPNMKKSDNTMKKSDNTTIKKKQEPEKQKQEEKNSFTVLSEDYVSDKNKKVNKKEEMFPPLGLGLVGLNKQQSRGMNYLEKVKIIPIISKPILKKECVYDHPCIQWSDELSSVEYDSDFKEDFEDFEEEDFEDC